MHCANGAQVQALGHLHIYYIFRFVTNVWILVFNILVLLSASLALP